MKKLLISFSILLALYACGTSKKTAQNSTNVSKSIPLETELTTEEEIAERKLAESLQLSVMVNTIIEKNTSSKASQIARSPVTQTESGYTWKFTNVSTGKSYKVQTNEKFEEVEISKLSTP
ncbi:hypothetical protein NBT05_02225 [Aquimarina sp. ERC-38]|uniref:hypothetical protein n=1 Tax=Aquimarina sp. ERC-38 TaxID=2949996 RepID=UPI0022458899|nr:hypothetical protein [Aquimarina sp. ERC-38]UZO81301.1 hypothetical protein NBT05_02225 [Aquimarina sp. ERC-38]